jgi:hypothetical protein
MHLAQHRELLEAIIPGELRSGGDPMGLKEAERLVRFHERREKIKKELWRGSPQ